MYLFCTEHKAISCKKMEKDVPAAVSVFFKLFLVAVVSMDRSSDDNSSITRC